jgi:anti-anti-sigma regulatory factor
MALSVQTFNCGTCEQTNMTLRIEKDSDGQTTTLRLIGRMQREHIEELKAQIKAGGTSITLDLNEVSLVDLDVIHFLATCQTEGIFLVHCSHYINNWIAKERFGGQ